MLETLAVIAELLSSGAQMYGASQAGQSQFTPTESRTAQKTRLLPESEDEAQLSELANLLAYSLMKSDYASPGGITADMLGLGEVGGVGASDLMAGELDSATRARLERQAYGGLEEAGQRISAGATEGAMGRGLGMSSVRDSLQGEMMQPLVAQASQNYGALYQNELGRQAQTRMAELERQRQLRQTALQNSLMIQQSPALERLLRIRMAQPMSAGYEQNVQAGSDYMNNYKSAMYQQNPSAYGDTWLHDTSYSGR